MLEIVNPDLFRDLIMELAFNLELFLGPEIKIVHQHSAFGNREGALTGKKAVIHDYFNENSLTVL